MITRCFLLTALLTACSPRAQSTAPPQQTVVPEAKRPSRDAPRPIWISPVLRVPETDFAAALDAPFDDAIPVVDRAKTVGHVTNCRDYFRLSNLGFSAGSEENHAILRTEGVRCQAIKRAADMKPGAGDPVAAFLNAESLTQRLPATVGPSVSDDELVMREASAKKGQSWNQYATPLTVDIKNGAATVKESDSISELRPLAAGDLNGDEIQDLLVQAICSGTEGSWVDVRLLVLSPVTRPSTEFFQLIETVRP